MSIPDHIIAEVRREIAADRAQRTGITLEEALAPYRKAESTVEGNNDYVSGRTSGSTTPVHFKESPRIVARTTPTVP